MRTDLPALVRKWENYEFKNNKDLEVYAELTRTIATEMFLRSHMNARVIQGLLGRYKGRWYHFGVSSKVKARICAAYLKLGAEALKQFGIAAARFSGAFDKHFVQPEREARTGFRKAPARGGGFTIDV